MIKELKHYKSMKGKLYFLKPVLYNQKDYYNKAHYIYYICDNDLVVIKLFSYNMHVATLYLKDVYPCYRLALTMEVIQKNKLTQTTKKHIRDFYYQFTNKYITSKEMKYISTL